MDEMLQDKATDGGTKEKGRVVGAVGLAGENAGNQECKFTELVNSETCSSV